MVRSLLLPVLLCACTATNPDYSGDGGDAPDAAVELDLAPPDEGVDDQDGPVGREEGVLPPDGATGDGPLPDLAAARDGAGPDAARDDR